MPMIRADTIGPIAPTSDTTSGRTPESAMMKPMTVPISPSSTRLLARCRIGVMRLPNLSRRLEASIALVSPARPATAAI